MVDLLILVRCIFLLSQESVSCVFQPLALGPKKRCSQGQEENREQSQAWVLAAWI